MDGKQLERSKGLSEAYAGLSRGDKRPAIQLLEQIQCNLLEMIVRMNNRSD